MSALPRPAQPSSRPAASSRSRDHHRRDSRTRSRPQPTARRWRRTGCAPRRWSRVLPACPQAAVCGRHFRRQRSRQPSIRAPPTTRHKLVHHACPGFPPMPTDQKSTVRTNAAETYVLVPPTCTTQRILPVRHGQPCDTQHETTRSQYALDQPTRSGRAGGQGRDRTADLPLFGRRMADRGPRPFRV